MRKVILGYAPHTLPGMTFREIGEVYDEALPVVTRIVDAFGSLRCLTFFLEHAAWAFPPFDNTMPQWFAELAGCMRVPVKTVMDMLAADHFDVTAFAVLQDYFNRLDEMRRPGVVTNLSEVLRGVPPGCPHRDTLNLLLQERRLHEMEVTLKWEVPSLYSWLYALRLVVLRLRAFDLFVAGDGDRAIFEQHKGISAIRSHLLMRDDPYADMIATEWESDCDVAVLHGTLHKLTLGPMLANVGVPYTEIVADDSEQWADGQLIVEELPALTSVRARRLCKESFLRHYIVRFEQMAKGLRVAPTSGDRGFGNFMDSMVRGHRRGGPVFQTTAAERIAVVPDSKIDEWWSAMMDSPGGDVDASRHRMCETFGWLTSVQPF